MKLKHALILFAALWLGACSSQKGETVKAASKAVEPLAVRTAAAEARTVERAIMVTGSLAPDESVTVSAEVAGRVKTVYVDFGQAVKKGQLLAELDPLEFQLQLQRSRSALAQALARLGLPADAAPDARPEETPAMKQAKAQLDDAKSKFDRTAKLVKTGDVAQESYIAAEKAYQAREAAYESMRDDMLTQWAAISGLRAEVALAEKRLRDTKLYAPFDGAVTQRQVSPGQYIKDNTPVLSVVKNWPLRLRVEIPEPAVSEVKVGSELSFTTEAVPGETFHARVRELNPSLDPRSRTLTAEAMLAKADPRLRPGAFVQVRLVTEKAAPVIAIPKDAVYTVAGLNKFFTIENGKAVEHKIPEVLGSDGWVEMPEGTIAAGARVAVSNVAMLTNGAPVTVVGGRS